MGAGLPGHVTPAPLGMDALQPREMGSSERSLQLELRWEQMGAPVAFEVSLGFFCLFRERKARRISVALGVRGRRQAGAGTWGRRSEEPKLKESIPMEEGEGIRREQRAAGQGQAAPRGSQSR